MFGTPKLQAWPTAIVTVLVAQIGFGIWMARVARDDPHFAIEPDYYARAVNWDSTMAQSRLDKALGWRASIAMARADVRSATVRLDLTDSTGTVVDADSVVAELLPVAHAGRIDTLALTRDGSAYRATMPVAANGLWEAQVRAHRGSALFTAKLRTELR